jgi:hypothetical protein
MNNIATAFDIELARKSLVTLQPKKSGEQETINALYADIKDSLDRGVTRNAVIEQLAALGLKLHPAKFKRLMSSAAAQHNESFPPNSRKFGGGKK